MEIMKIVMKTTIRKIINKIQQTRLIERRPRNLIQELRVVAFLKNN